MLLSTKDSWDAILWVLNNCRPADREFTGCSSLYSKYYAYLVSSHWPCLCDDNIPWSCILTIARCCILFDTPSSMSKSGISLLGPINMPQANRLHQCLFPRGVTLLLNCFLHSDVPSAKGSAHAENNSVWVKSSRRFGPKMIDLKSKTIVSRSGTNTIITVGYKTGHI